MMHFAKLDKSNRLKKTLAALAGNRWKTTDEIRRQTKSVAVHSDISELRRNNKDIICRYDHKEPNGSRVYRYRLLRPREQEGA